MFARVKRTDLPKGSLLWTLVGSSDFLDCYTVPSNLSPRVAAGVAFAFPAWVKALLVARNVLVRPFGLKQGDSGDDRVTIFPVTAETADEIVMGFDDSHLDFRVAMRREDGQAYVSTWVHPHNWLGRLYLIVVTPFHIVIMRSAMARVARNAQLEAGADTQVSGDGASGSDQ